MGMTLEEAIKHCREVADYDCYNEKDIKRRNEHWQLAEWLEELYHRRQNDRDWICCRKQLPEPEKEVEVTVEVRLVDGKRKRFTCRAFYEDGNTTLDNSDISEWDFDDDELYDPERDDWFVPEGWYGSNDYCEQFTIIDDFVIAWRDIPKPYGIEATLD